eukprot:SAG11_NODE_133_length_15400_cov_10.132344_6_plen_63_part_00
MIHNMLCTFLYSPLCNCILGGTFFESKVQLRVKNSEVAVIAPMGQSHQPPRIRRYRTDSTLY